MSEDLLADVGVAYGKGTGASSDDDSVSLEHGLGIEGLFTNVPGNQKVFLDTMEACRTPRTPAELDELMGGILKTNRSVFRPVELRAALELHGAIAYRQSESEVAAGSALTEDGEIDEDEPVEVDEDGFLVMRIPEPGTWLLTPEGVAYLDANPLGALADDLVSREGHYAEVYVALLEALMAGPKDMAALSGISDPMPICQSPRMFAGHFLGELEKAAAIEWLDAWVITGRGRDLLTRFQASATSNAQEGETR